MNSQPTLTPKKIFISLLLFIFLYTILWFLFSYSWIAVSSSSDKDIFITISNKNEEAVRTFEQFSGSKTLFLKRDTYKIEAAKGDEFSAYKKSLGFLWFNKLDVELFPQKSSKFLGVSALSCAKGNLFYPCDYSYDAHILKDGGTTQRFQALTTTDTGSQEQENFSSLITPYRDGFLEIASVGTDLFIGNRNSLGEPSQSPPVEIKDFQIYGGGEAGSSALADSSEAVPNRVFSASKDSDNFVAYSSKENILINFKNSTDNNPMKIPAPQDRNKSGLINKVLASKDYIYFVSTVPYEIEDHSHVEAGAEGETEDSQVQDGVDQKIFIFSTQTGNLEAEHSIPSNWQIRNAESGPDSKMVFVADKISEEGNELGTVYAIDGSSTPSEIETIANTPQDICWKDKDSFYYLTDAGRSIYRYSLSQQASFLVYSGLQKGKFISHIRCNSGELYFSFNLTSETRRLSDKYSGYHHYKLSDEDFTGIRLEGLLPVFVVVGGVGGDIVEVNLTSALQLSIEMNLRGGKALLKEDIRDAVIEKLRDEGVNTEKLQLNFKF